MPETTPDATPPFAVPLLDNYRRFLQLHRGHVSRRPGALLVESEEPDFTWALIENARAVDELARFSTVRVPPWSTLTPDALRAHGYRPAGGLIFMVRPHTAPPLQPNRAVEVSEARTDEELARFTDVQTDGFLDEGDDRARWHGFLGRANRANRGDAQQHFYLGWLGGQPVGVTLLLTTEQTAGIYAVATLPAHRKQSVASTLLAHAAAAARGQGCTTLSLQVARGSAAERLYKSQGFVEAFALETWQR